MKYSAFFKFLAVLLCAASLVTAGAAGLGIALNMEMGYYDTAPETVRRQQLEQLGRSMADTVAREFVSAEIGGASEGLIDELLGSYGLYGQLDYTQVGYRLKDASGNTVQSLNDWVGNADVWEFTPQGKYIRVITDRTLAEYEEENSPKATEAPEESLAAEVPEESAATEAPAATAAGVTEPETTEARVTGPEATETGVTEPEATETGVTEPEATEARVTEPEATEAASVPETAREQKQTADSNGFGTDTPAETQVPPTEPVLLAEDTSLRVVPSDERRESATVFYRDNGVRRVAEVVWEDLQGYRVEVRLPRGALLQDRYWDLMKQLYALQDSLLPALAGSLLVLMGTLVYLCCAAGRSPGSLEVRPGGLNRLPLELSAGFVGLILMTAVAALDSSVPGYLLEQDLFLGVALLALGAWGCCLGVVGLVFACAAQFKTPGGYWWKNSLCGRCLRLALWSVRKLLKLMEWLWEKGKNKLWPLVKKLAMIAWAGGKGLLRQLWKWLRWGFALVGKGLEALGRGVGRFLSLLPLTWQWLLTAFGMLVLMLLAYATNMEEFLTVLCVLIYLSIVLYGTHAFGSLMEGVRRMNRGNLEEKVDDRLLVGCFKDFARELNGLADVAVVAAQNQMKSERMKTELITNVTHDIKTPLTSIINYVDLLEKPHTGEEQTAYLEVLSRQSQRLKKLIEDLMEMSKASTGNITVDIRRLDAAEAVSQALGEFSDKLEAAGLVPVFRRPEKDVFMLADGKLVWRVMSNLLSNAVKYALPGTRVYMDLELVEGKVIISMKNISREALNVNADELLERFVRGDASRNTEGSGLGLNIARSLMELQKGQLQLLVDGDLFKVTLIFPGA